MPILAFIGLGLLVYVTAFGGASSAELLPTEYLMTPTSILPERALVRAELRRASAEHGLDPSWLDAIAWVESRWQLSAYNPSDPGGAWGPCQMLGVNIRKLGHEPAEVLRDAVLAADLAAQFMASAGAQDLTAAATWWNHGSFYGAPTSTTTQYVPAVIAAAEQSRGEEIS